MRTRTGILLTVILLGAAAFSFATSPQPVTQQQRQTPQPAVKQPVNAPRPAQVIQPRQQPVQIRTTAPQTKQPVSVQPVRQTQPVQPPGVTRTVTPPVTRVAPKTPTIQVTPPKTTLGTQTLQVTPPRTTVVKPPVQVTPPRVTPVTTQTLQVRPPAVSTTTKQLQVTPAGLKTGTVSAPTKMPLSTGVGSGKFPIGPSGTQPTKAQTNSKSRPMDDRGIYRPADSKGGLTITGAKTQVKEIPVSGPKVIKTDTKTPSIPPNYSQGGKTAGAPGKPTSAGGPSTTKPSIATSVTTGAVTAQSLVQTTKAPTTPAGQMATVSGARTAPGVSLTKSATATKSAVPAKQAIASSSPTAQSQQAKLESAILKYTNAERVKAGLPPLKVSSALDTVADIHSKNQAYAQTMAHDSSKFPAGYQTMSDRTKKIDFGSSYSTRENVLFTSAKPTGATDAGMDAYAKNVVNQWMNSPGHKANILSKDSSHIGIGMKDGYATQVFASSEGRIKPGAIPTQPTSTTATVSGPTTKTPTQTTTTSGPGATKTGQTIAVTGDKTNTTVKTPTGSPSDGKTTTTPGGKTTAAGPVTSGTTTGTAPTGAKVAGGSSAIPEIKPTGRLVEHADDRVNGPIYIYSDGTRVQHTFRDPEVRTVITSKLGETRIYRDGTTKTFPPKTATAPTATTGTGASGVTSGLTPIKIPKSAPIMHADDFKNGPIYVYPGGVSVQHMIGDTNVKTVVKSAQGETHYYKDGSSKTFPPKSGASSTPGTGKILFSQAGLSADDKTAIQQAAKQSVGEGLGKTALDTLKGQPTDNVKNVLDSFTSNLDKKSAKQLEMEQKFKEKLAQIREKRAKDAAQTSSPVADPLKESQKSSSAASKDKAVTATPDKLLTQENKDKLTALEDRKKWLESRTFSPTTHDNVPALEAKRQEELTKINSQINELKSGTKSAASSGATTKTGASDTSTKLSSQESTSKSGAKTTTAVSEGAKVGSQTGSSDVGYDAVLKKAKETLAKYEEYKKTGKGFETVAQSAKEGKALSETTLQTQLPKDIAQVNRDIAGIEKSLREIDPKIHDQKYIESRKQVLDSLKASRDQMMAVAKTFGAGVATATPVSPGAAPNAGAISSLQGKVADIDNKLLGVRQTIADPNATPEAKRQAFITEANLLATREETRNQIHTLKAQDQFAGHSPTSGVGSTLAGAVGGASLGPSVVTAAQQIPPVIGTPRIQPPGVSSWGEPPPPPDFGYAESRIDSNNELINRWTQEVTQLEGFSNRDTELETQIQTRRGDIQRLLGENADLTNQINNKMAEHRDELEAFEQAKTAAQNPDEKASTEKTEDPFKLVRNVLETFEEGKQKLSQMGSEFYEEGKNRLIKEKTPEYLALLGSGLSHEEKLMVIFRGMADKEAEHQKTIGGGMKKEADSDTGQPINFDDFNKNFFESGPDSKTRTEPATPASNPFEE